MTTESIPASTEAAPEKSVTVFVRLGDDESARVLSFARLPEITDDEALENDYAIDGRDFVTNVASYWDWDRGAERQVSLQQALLDEQIKIKRWLGSHGYAVVFR